MTAGKDCCLATKRPLCGTIRFVEYRLAGDMQSVFIRVHNEALKISMRVNNPDGSPFGIDR